MIDIMKYKNVFEYSQDINTGIESIKDTPETDELIDTLMKEWRHTLEELSK